MPSEYPFDSRVTSARIEMDDSDRLPPRESEREGAVASEPLHEHSRVTFNTIARKR